MAFGKKREDVLRRSLPSWKPAVSQTQYAALMEVNDNLWLCNSTALEERQKAFEVHLAPLYNERREADKRGDKAAVHTLSAQIKSAFDHMPDLASQINALTGRRSEHEFHELRGRSGFKLVEGKRIVLSCKAFGETTVEFDIPPYQQNLLVHPLVEVKEFKLVRVPADIRQQGHFQLSLAYEMPKPATLPFVPEQAVYVALGSWALAIVSPQGEETVHLSRPDVHWRPLEGSVNVRLEHVTKGSRAWKRRTKARRVVFRKMSLQQKQARRETVAHELLGWHLHKLVRHGVHFVVSELVVRSKKRKLADTSRQGRGGATGPNASAQNTGAREIPPLEEGK